MLASLQKQNSSLFCRDAMLASLQKQISFIIEKKYIASRINNPEIEFLSSILQKVFLVRIISLSLISLRIVAHHSKS